VRQPQKLPVVLTPKEVARLIEAAPSPKYKAALGAAYGAGLRVSEVANLRVSDIDSERTVIRVEQDRDDQTPCAGARQGRSNASPVKPLTTLNSLF
jgi:integrase